MSEEPNFETFSVGVKADTNDLRRVIMDAVALVNGRQNRLRNHTFCFERMMFGLHSLMLDAPEAFAGLFGDGETAHRRNYLAWLKEKNDGKSE